MLSCPPCHRKWSFWSTLSNSYIVFNVAIGFFNFKNSSQREPSKKYLGRFLLVMHGYVVRMTAGWGATEVYWMLRPANKISWFLRVYIQKPARGAALEQLKWRVFGFRAEGTYTPSCLRLKSLITLTFPCLMALLNEMRTVAGAPRAVWLVLGGIGELRDQRHGS